MHLTRHDKNKWESRKIEEEVLLLSKQKMGDDYMILKNRVSYH